MGTMQTQKTGKDHHVLLPNNPFVPPRGDVCYINNLPPELLSHIFEVGAADNESEDDDDDADYTDYVRLYHLDAMDADDNDIHHDVETMEELEDDDREGDEEEADDEGVSDATGSSDIPALWPPFQVVVSHVCRHWRNIAFSTPSIWTTIIVSPDARPPYQYVSTRLERSKDLPINIYVDCEPQEQECPTDLDATDSAGPSPVDLKFLYSLLISHIHRWRTVEVSVSKYRDMHMFLIAASDPSISAAPQLTTLELYHHAEMDEFDNFGYPSISKPLILFGGSAPCLTSLVLWGVHVDWNQPWIASASKLTHLELAFHPEDVRPSWAQFTTILRGASALEKLSLRMSGPSEDPPWLIEPTPGSPIDLNAPIQLLKVTDFIFAFYSPARSIALLHKFYLPALKNLALDFDDGDYTDLVFALAGPATSLSLPSTHEQPRSLLNSLESLKIAGLPCRTEHVDILYEELQNLTSLNISLTHLSPLFLDILTTPCMVAGRGDIWLPRLATLYVSGTSGDVLREVVQKRMDAGVPLDSLYVEASCDLDEENAEWLKDNLKTFDFFEGSDDEDDTDFEDMDEEIDEWSDMD